MRIYRNFKCQDCEGQKELMIDNTVDCVPCDDCGGISVKMLSMPRFGTNSVGKNASWSKKTV